MTALALEAKEELRRIGPPEAPELGALERFVLASNPWIGRLETVALLRAAIGELNIALCLHRVRESGPVDWLAIAASELDALIAMLAACRPKTDRPWLTIAFDDGYDDAAQYIRTRAPKHPDVEWLMFVCPKRTEKRLAFSWDPPRGGEDLASLETLRQLQRLPNVALGNHTNSHVRQHTLSDAQAENEYQQSFSDFARLFGGRAHFAFPFGTPGLTFGADHVAKLRRIGAGTIWSTEHRPYRDAERHPGAVLPRFPVNGSWKHEQIALWISLLTLKYRMVGTRFRY